MRIEGSGSLGFGLGLLELQGSGLLMVRSYFQVERGYNAQSSIDEELLESRRSRGSRKIDSLPEALNTRASGKP